MARKRNRSSSSSSDSDSSREDRSRRGGRSGDRDEGDGKGRERDRRDRDEGRDRDRGRRDDEEDRRRDSKEGVNGEGSASGEGSRDTKGADQQKMSLMERTIKMGKSGGAYIPPFRLKQMMQEVQDRSSPEYQRMTWEGLKKSINGLVNKVTKSNITSIVHELFSQNLVRARGLYARSVMKAQLASPAFTSVSRKELPAAHH
jgi:pre-mRNA-splicing factor CWC22